MKIKGGFNSFENQQLGSLDKQQRYNIKFKDLDIQKRKEK